MEVATLLRQVGCFARLQVCYYVVIIKFGQSLVVIT